jgi:hypothetical protein
MFQKNTTFNTAVLLLTSYCNKNIAFALILSSIGSFPVERSGGGEHDDISFIPTHNISMCYLNLPIPFLCQKFGLPFSKRLFVTAVLTCCQDNW